MVESAKSFSKRNRELPVPVEVNLGPGFGHWGIENTHYSKEEWSESSRFCAETNFWKSTIRPCNLWIHESD
jgi:hypothetical protein